MHDAARMMVHDAQAGSGGDLADLGALAQSPTIEAAVAAVRGFLGMDLAYATRIDPEVQVLETFDGDSESFGLHPGMEIPLEKTYCQRVLAGRLPNLIPDVGFDERAASLEISKSANVGSFVSVPLTFSDGRLYGTLCAGSHEAKPGLGYRDLQFLHVFARMVSDQLEREELTRDAERLQEVAHDSSSRPPPRRPITAVQARDSYTAEHSHAVVHHAVAVAPRDGLDDARGGRGAQRRAAARHRQDRRARRDPTKPGPLNEEEWEVMRCHPARQRGMVRRDPRPRAPRADGARRARALGRHGLPRRPFGRADPAGQPHHPRLRRLPRHDQRPSLPRGDVPPSGARTEITANLGTQFCPHAGSALLAVLNRR